MNSTKDEAPTLAGDEAPKSTLTSHGKNDMTNSKSSTHSLATADSLTNVSPAAATSSAALVPVFIGTIQGHTAQLCDARTLHTFMGVLRDFTDWVKARILKFGFIEGTDFLKIIGPPEKGNQKRGGNRKGTTDYHLTLDMAKELSMVENNAKGREARRYFMECEKQVLAALTVHPTDRIDYARISPAQAQHLKELVADTVASGKQTHPETWARLQRKFRVNSYLELPAARFDEACDYLIAKLPEATTLPAFDRFMPTLAAANEVAAHVQAAVFKALLSGDKRWQNERWMLSFKTGRGDVVTPHAQQIDGDALIMTLTELAKAIDEPGGMLPTTVEMLALLNAVTKRLTHRLEYQAKKQGAAAALGV
jgi:phage anti-repressor protein